MARFTRRRIVGAAGGLVASIVARVPMVGRSERAEAERGGNPTGDGPDIATDDDRGYGESPIGDPGGSPSVSQVARGNVFRTDETPAVEVRTDGQTAVWRLHDVRNERLARGTVEDGTRLELPVDGVGHYTLHVRTDEPSPATTRTTLAALPADGFDHDDAFFGMSTQFNADLSLELLDVVEAIGVESIREDTGWGRIERTRGEYDFSAVDDYLEPIGDRGFDRLAILAYGNDVYDPADRGYFTVPDTDEYRRGFADFSRETVSRYDDVDHVEVWNEPNIDAFAADPDPAVYASLLETAATAVGDERADVAVVGGATAGMDFEWWEGLLAAGGAEHADVLSVHPYRTPATGFAADVDRLREMVESRGHDAPPIWVTELGWGTAPWLAGGGRERRQARYLVRSHVRLRGAGVERFYWYTLGDTVFEGNASPQTYDGSYRMGLVRHSDDPLGAETPKPGLVAYATMTRRLAGAEFVAAAADPLEGAVFERNGERTRVVWSGELTDVTVRADAPVTLTTALGTERRLTPVDGELFLTVGPDPLYLTGPVESITRGTPTTLETVETEADEPGRLRVGVTAADDSLSATHGIADRSVSLAADPGETVLETIDLPGPYRPGTATVVDEISVAGEPAGRLLTRVGTPHARFGDPPVFAGLTVDTRNEGDGLVGYSSANDAGTDYSDFDRVTRNGVAGWRTDFEAGFTADALYVDVDDDHLSDVGGTVPVTVRYFDEGTGLFTVAYDAADGERAARPVSLEDAGIWKTHTFELDGARFANELGAAAEWHTDEPGYDFSVGVGHETVGWSDEDVILESITIGTEPATPLERTDATEADGETPDEIDGAADGDDSEGDDGPADEGGAPTAGAEDGETVDGGTDDVVPGPGIAGALTALAGVGSLLWWRRDRETE